MRPTIIKLLDWLDRRDSCHFIIMLYVFRWIVLIPILVLDAFLLNEAQSGAASMPNEWSELTPIGLFLGLVIVPPLLETIIECTIPFWIFARVRNYQQMRPVRCWGFITVSACIMAMLHPMIAAIVPAFITGGFLAYCYAHFAPRSIWKAILATFVFHAAINMVGWSILVLL